MPRYARILLITVALASALLATAMPASAATKAVKASALKGDTLVFKLRGKVKPRLVTSAGVRYGKVRRRVSARSVRRAARRGLLKIRLRRRARRAMLRKLRRERRLAAQRRAAGRPAPPPAKPRLVVTIKPTPKPQPWTEKTCPVPAGANYVSPSGSDSNPGTQASPWRTLDHAEEQAEPGTTVVVRGGTYGKMGSEFYLTKSGRSGAPISWIGHPGETVLIKGHMSVEGDNRRFCGLVFDGPTGDVSPHTPDGERDKIYAGGDNFELMNSEIRGSRWHAGIYLHQSDNFKLTNNYIHDNGRFDDPSHANLDHGVYVGSGSGVIEDNRIEDNYAYGVQLYPYADGVVVRRNRIKGHGRAGVIFAEEAANNEVVDNDIYGNQRGIQAWSLTGKGNAARNNRLWDNREGDFISLDGVSVSGNERR